MKNRYILLLFFIATSFAAQGQNVGVGIAAPNDLFHVSGNAAQGILFNNATTGSALTNGLRITIDATKNVLFNQQEIAEMQFLTSGAARMRIDATGHVAINGAPIAAEQLFVQGSNTAGTIASVNVNSAVNSAGVVGVGNTGVSTLPGATAYGVMGDVGIGNANVGVAGYLGTPVNMSAAQAAGVYGAVNNLSSGVGIYGLATAAKVNVAGYFTSGGGVTSNFGIQSVVTGASGTNYGFNSSVTSTSLANYGVYSVVNGAAGAGSTNTAGYFAASGATGALSTNYGINIGAGDLLINKLSGGVSVNIAGLNPYSFMVADATGLVGKITTSFPPPGNSLEMWMRPSGQFYIQPVSNANIQVYDNIVGTPQPYGIYYNGSSNAIGGFFVTTGIPAGYTKSVAVEGFSNIVGATAIGYLGYDGPYTFGSPVQTLQGFAVYGEVTQANRASGFFQTSAAATVAANINYSNVWIPNYDYVDNASTVNFPPCVYAQTNQTGIMGGVLPVPSGGISSYYSYTPATNFGFSVGVSGVVVSTTQDGIGVQGISFSNNGNGANENIGGDFESYNNSTGTNESFCYVGARIAGAQYKIFGTGGVSEIIPTADHGRITLTCPESPEYWYQDYGSVQLINGKAHVDLDPILAYVIVVDKDNPLKVFCTPVDMEDFNGVTIMNRSASGFDIVELNKGKHSGEIDYQIVAKPKTNYGAGRFAQAPGPSLAPKNIPAAQAVNQPSTRKIFNWPSDDQVYHYKVQRPQPQSANKPDSKANNSNGEGIHLPAPNNPH